MYLSYSGFKCAVSCLYLYWHTYINYTPHGKPDDRLGSIYGSAVGRIFEQFYVEQLWRKPNTVKVVESRVEQVVDDLLVEETQPKKGKPGGVILWRGEGEGQNPHGMYHDRYELVRDVRSAVQRGLLTIKKELLLSTEAEVEEKLDTQVGPHLLAGRPDFMMTRIQYEDRVVVDGKGTRHVTLLNGKFQGKYTEKDQLLWYCMLHRENRGTLPDKAAFLYWRYEPPANVCWIDVTQNETDKVKRKALKVADRIEELSAGLTTPKSLEVVQEYFTPKATQQNCQFCPYATQSLCPKGFEKVEQIRERWANRKR